MVKDITKLFFVMWLINFFVLLTIVLLGDFYYPVHSWLFTGQWRWDSFERSMRFYKACVPASFFVALIITFAEWTEMRKKDKKTDEQA